MIRPLRPARAEAGVSLGATSAYTPNSRTLRAIRWQYCPPASRTVICACNPATLGTTILLRHALHQQLLGGLEQRPGLWHGVDGSRHGRVLLLGDALRFLEAERGDVHLPLQLFLDPLMVLGELGFGEVDSV